MTRSTTTQRLLFLRRPTLVWSIVCICFSSFLLACGEKKEAPQPIEPLDLSGLEEAGDKSPDSKSDSVDDKTPPGDVQPDTETQEEKPVEETPARKTFAKHEGPWFWILRSSAAIYKNPKPNRKEKLGYIKRGGKLGIYPDKVEGDGCPRGWYQVATGGYICSHTGTADEKHKDVKFRPAQPNVEEILPYKYARNSKNGTPLYRSIPSKKQTFRYEPYLPGAVAEREKQAKLKADDDKQMREAGLAVDGDPPPPDSIPTKDGGEKPTKESKKPASEKSEKSAKKGQSEAKQPPEKVAQAAPEEDPDVPLWEREENLHEVTLEDLRKDKDDILDSRMMKGFYVAIDKTFKWDDRTWYKTTKGLVTPSENFWQTAGSDFQGVEIDGEEIQLPIGWVFGGRKSAPTYEINEETNERKPKGSKKKFEMVELKYSYHRIGKIDYFQMKDGDWIRDYHIRMTTPGPRPEEVGPFERWIDVDISEQTLVVFEGDRPVYATLISSGKQSKNKDKDHSTPRGMWRVREKHIASTMDGNGTAAGDLPYSIEDVPYIMYFHKSYATHGAFWHRNYGVQMSHGCVNLAPLDAKWIFFYADPQLPPGFHGNWSSDDDKGSWVVVHD